MNTKTSVIVTSVAIAAVLVLFAGATLIINPAFAYCSGGSCWGWGYHSTPGGGSSHWGYEWDPNLHK
jgi:hypothetical protein